jgi:hypothetical protein
VEQATTTLDDAEAKLGKAVRPQQFLADRAVKRARTGGKPGEALVVDLAKGSEAAKQPFKGGRGLFRHDSGS